MIERGKLVILVILGLALAAAAGSWCYHRARGDRALRFWGSSAALLIRRAPHVELLRLAPHQAGRPMSNKQIVQIGHRAFDIVDRRDITHAPGLIYVRGTLTDDASFGWHDPPRRGPHPWRLAVRFEQRDQCVTIALDAACQNALLCERDRSISLRPIASGLRVFFAEQLQAAPTHSPHP